MAYGNQQNTGNQYNNRGGNNGARPAVAAGATKKTDKVKVAGIYPYEKKDGTASKLLYKGKTMSDVSIPAGYSVSIFVAGGKSKNGKDLPPFEIVATPPLAK